MTDDRFLERLREDARALQYEGDAFLATRIAARVRDRIHQPATVSQLLAAWMRPLAASLVALVVTATLSFAWSARHAEQPGETISSSPIEIAMAGETFGVGD